MALNAFKCSPLSCILNSLTVKPALEKHLSEEADVAELQRYFESGCFGVHVWGKLFFIFAYHENFIYISSTIGLKFEFWQPHLGDPHFVTPNFVKFYLSFMFTYLENSMCLAKKV